MCAIRWIPNIITSVRIAGTLGLLLTPIFSPGFFVLYTICGVSDILDGMVARACGATSELGARLDSVADLLFNGVMLLRLVPVLLRLLPMAVWGIAVLAVGLRVAAYVTAGVKFRRFPSLHTYANKATSAGVFVVPYLINTPAGLAVCTVVGLLGLLSSMEELLIHLCSPSYPDTRTIFRLKPGK